MLLAALSARFLPSENRHAATSNFSEEIAKFGFSAIEEVQSFIVEPRLVVLDTVVLRKHHPMLNHARWCYQFRNLLSDTALGAHPCSPSQCFSVLFSSLLRSTLDIPLGISTIKAYYLDAFKIVTENFLLSQSDLHQYSWSTQGSPVITFLGDCWVHRPCWQRLDHEKGKLCVNSPSLLRVHW